MAVLNYVFNSNLDCFLFILTETDCLFFSLDFSLPLNVN